MFCPLYQLETPFSWITFYSLIPSLSSISLLSIFIKCSLFIAINISFRGAFRFLFITVILVLKNYRHYFFIFF
uniref:Uncharacterized protein n=1 Tax=Rhizophora mucronata TaxID=61149 RepID=A0A2P2KI77_RHIMU